MKKIIFIIFCLVFLPIQSNALTSLGDMADTILSPLVKDRNVPWALGSKEKIHQGPSRKPKTYLPPPVKKHKPEIVEQQNTQPQQQQQAPSAQSPQPEKRVNIYNNTKPNEPSEHTYHAPSKKTVTPNVNNNVVQKNVNNPTKNVNKNVEVNTEEKKEAYKGRPTIWYGGSWSSRRQAAVNAAIAQ